MADSNRTLSSLLLAVGLPMALGALAFSFVAFQRAGQQIALAETQVAQLSPDISSRIEAEVDKRVAEAVSAATADAAAQIEEQTRRVQALVDLQLDQQPTTTAPEVVEEAPVEPIVEVDPFAAGKTIARRQCISCHSFQEGQPHRVGPNLYGVFDQPAGQKVSYRYSRAMADSALVWTADALDEYLEKPRQYLAGTKMTYAGLKDDQARAEVIAYLSSLGSNL